MATTINVGLQSDGHVAIDFSEDDGWDFHELTIEEALFLHEELGEILQRADKRFPKGTPPKPGPEEEKGPLDEP